MNDLLICFVVGGLTLVLEVSHLIWIKNNRVTGG